MIYTIISNIGLAIMMIIIYGRYSKFKIAQGIEAQDLRKKIDQEIEAKKVIEDQILRQTKESAKKIETLLDEVDELRKTKESEFSLRLEAEKQIELALLKIEELQKRMKDWRLIQDAVMRDYKDSIIRIGNDLFKKLNDSYKSEAENFKKLNDNYTSEVEGNKGLIKGLLEKIPENMVESFEKIIDQRLVRQPKFQSQVYSSKPEKKIITKPIKAKSSANRTISAAIKKITTDLVEVMIGAGQVVNKDYFLPTNFTEKKAKLFLCDLTFISLRRLYIIDLKACNYFEEYDQQKSKDKSGSEAILKQKLDKYFSYLTNEKYRDLLVKLISSEGAEFDDSEIVMVLSSKDDLKFVKDTNYLEKMHASQISVMTPDELNNLVL